jgi:putative endonuclease
MTNRPNGTLYIGVTNDIARRVYGHRTDASGFTQRYGLFRLIFVDRHEEIVAAIQRETNIKKWPLAWKVRLIDGINPEWRDLYGELV